MFRRISFLLVLFFQFFFLDKSFCQKIDLIYPFEGQVFADEVLLEWNKLDKLENYKVFVSQYADFSSMDSFIVNNQAHLTFSPDTSFNSSYYFFVSSTNNSSTIFSDTSKFVYFNPKNISGLKLWVSSDLGVDTLNNSVQQWNDRSGNGNDLFMSNAAKQPSYIENGLNGFPNMYFDAVNDGMTSPVILDSTDYLMSVLYNCLDSSNTIRRTIHGSNNWLVGKYGTTYNIFAGAFTGGKPFVRNDYIVQTAKFSRDTLYNYINSINYGSVIPTKFPGQVGLGSWTGSNATNGNINEWLVYDTTINDSIRFLIEKYIMDKYAPPISLGADIKTCSFPIQIAATKNYLKTYLWSDNSTQDTFLVSTPGTYALTTTDVFGRTFTDSISISLDTTDFPVELPEDTMFCKGEVFNLNAGPEHFSYSWNTGSGLANIHIDSSGQYIVNRTNCLSNTTSDTINVSFHLPEFELGVDTTICFNTVFSLTPDTNFSQNVDYLWSTGSNFSTITVDSTAGYSLEVIDSVGCSFSDSIHVQLDSSLFNLSLGNDTSLCKGNKIGLLQPNQHITAYSWSTGSNDSVIQVDSSQTYHLTVTSQNCSFTDSIKVNIKGLAPLADFSFNNHCFGDSTQFIDSSKSMDVSNITGWKWDFGNGKTSMVQHPLLVFDSSGVKNISLTVETDSACSAIVQKQIQIHPKPVASFDHSLACEDLQLSFSDSSFLSSGQIESYSWHFDTLGSDTSKNPNFVFQGFGQYEISLFIESEVGCMDTLEKIIDVHPAPKANIDISGFCMGDSTFFQGNTSINSGSIVKHEWNLGNGSNSLGENTGTFYYQSGEYMIFLKATSDKGCSSLIKDSVDIKKLPVAGIANPDFCEAEPLLFNSNSSAVDDSIINHTFIFNDMDTSFNENPVFPSQAEGNYGLKLFVETSSGCIDSTVETISVHPKPIADFKLMNNFTSAPLKLEILNQSMAADFFLWEFGNGDTDTSKVPDYTYLDTGEYNLQLKAYNNFGCSDSISKTLSVFPSFLDAGVDDLILNENGGVIDVRAILGNTGSDIIHNFHLQLTFQNGLKMTERFDIHLLPGEKTEVELVNSLFFENLPDFACLEIVEVNNSMDEVRENNSKCISGPDDIFSISVSPNPVSDRLNIDVVLPISGVLSLEIYNSSGSKIQELDDLHLTKGYHYYGVETQNFSTGTYILKAVFNDKVITQKIVKH